MMVAYIMIGSISFIVLVGLMAYFIPLWYNPIKRDNRTSSQKILDHFVVKEDKCDLDEFVEFCKNNPVKYNYKNNQEE